MTHETHKKFISYEEYLNSFSWKALKKLKLEEDPLCKLCGNNSEEVHHLSYERLGFENEDDLVSLCKSCHHDCHYINNYQIKNEDSQLRKRYEELIELNGIEEQDGDDYQIDPTLPFYTGYINNLFLREISANDDSILSDGENIYIKFYIMFGGESFQEFDNVDNRSEIERIIEGYGADIQPSYCHDNLWFDFIGTTRNILISKKEDEGGCNYFYKLRDISLADIFKEINYSKLFRNRDDFFKMEIDFETSIKDFFNIMRKRSDKIKLLPSR